MQIKDKLSVKDFQKLRDAVGWKHLDEKDVKTSIKKSMFVVSAVDDGQTIGMGRIIGDSGTHGTLVNVIVLPEYQGKGVGKKLVLRLMERCQEFADKHDQFIVEIVPSAGNHEFYVKCGFKSDATAMEGCYKWFKNEKYYSKDSKEYVYHLNEGPFNSIKRKKKKIEMRLFDDKRQKLKVEDILIFVNKNDESKMIKTKIIALHKFENFEQLYKNFNKIKLGYRKSEKANPKDMEKYYSAEDIKKYGIVGIEIEVIK